MSSFKLYFLITLLVIPAYGAESLSPEAIRRQASDLLFFLGSSDTTITKSQMEHLKTKEGEAVGVLYQRVYENRQKKKDANAYVNKEKREDGTHYYFKQYEIRAAVLELLLELGDGALEVLLESIHSSRMEIVHGIVKALDQFEDSRVVLLMSDILELDKWGRSKFSSLVRRQAVYNLRKYIEIEMAQIIIMRCIVDLDVSVRQGAQYALEYAGEGLEDYVSKCLIEGYNFEYQLYEKDLEAAKSKGLVSQFMKR